MSTSPLSAAAPRLGQRLFVLALLLLFAGLSVKHGLKVLQDRSAFRRWQPQLLELDKGVDIARVHNYPNPPVMAVLLEPLAKLPPLAGALTWFYLKVGMALLALRWVLQLVEDPERPFPPWARAAAVLLSLKPVVDDLNHGNVNLLILFLVVAALALYARRRDFLAGVVLALAVACKVTPALFLPYLVWKRAWRTLAGAVVGLGLFLWPGVVPALRLGFEENQRQLTSWYEGMVRPFLVEGQVTSEHNNQSLPGLASRLLSRRPSFSTWVDNVYTPTHYHHLVDLPPVAVKRLVQGCMALFALAVVCCCRTPTEPRRGWRLAAEYGLIVLGMLLFSERTWKHHAVTLALPVAVLCYFLAACRPSRPLAAYLGGTLAVTTALTLVTGLGSSPTSPGKQAQLYGAYVWVYVLLALALAVLLRKFPARERTQGEGG